MSKHRLIIIFLMLLISGSFLSGQTSSSTGCGMLTDAERVAFGPNITIESAEVFPADSGFIFIKYTITDDNADPAKVVFRFSINGTDFVKAKIPEVVNLSDTALPTSLPSEDPPLEYLLVFDTREVNITISLLLLNLPE